MLCTHRQPFKPVSSLFEAFPFAIHLCLLQFFKSNGKEQTTTTKAMSKKPFPLVVAAGDAQQLMHVLSVDVGIVNLGVWYGTIEPRTLVQKTLYWSVVDVVAELNLEWPNVQKVPIHECCDAVDMWLKNHLPVRTKPVDIVLIEQQPAGARFQSSSKAPPSNTRMFGLSLTLRSTLKQLFPSAFVPNFVSAKKKLLALPDPHVGDDEPNSSKRRRLHKNATVAYVKTIDDLPKDQGSKLDDLADCYMQARAWMKEQEDWRLAISNRKTKAAERAQLRKQLKSACKKDKHSVTNALVETGGVVNDDACTSDKSHKPCKPNLVEKQKVAKARKPRRKANTKSTTPRASESAEPQQPTALSTNGELNTDTGAVTNVVAAAAVVDLT